MKASLFKSLPIAAATAVALGSANPALADAYAVSAANVTDLVITTTPSIVILPGVTTSNSSATLNGNSSVSGTAADALASNAPGSNAAALRLNNVFNQFGQSNANYSNADAVIDSQQTQGAASTQVRSIGESFGMGDIGSTSSNGSNGSITGFFVDVQVVASTVLSFSFNAFKYLQAALSLDAKVPGSSASADIEANITLVDQTTGLTVFNWSPDGANTGAAGVTGTIGGAETADSFDLNQTISVAFPGFSPTQTSGAGCMIDATNMAVGAAAANGCFGAFAATTNAIGPGAYSLGLTVKTGTVIASVPTPGTLALLGMGILGAFASLRGRKKTV